MNGASDWRKEIRTIPNLLSIIRILLLPFYLYFMSKQAFYLAGSIILFSGVTDFLDGYIARRFNQITELGKVLDPIGDKLTQLVLIISMAWERPYIWLVLALFIVKEAFMVIAGIVALRKQVKLDGAKWYGKWATAVIYVGMILLLLFPAIPEGWVMVIFAIITYSLAQSFVLYALEYRKLLKR
ncbi:MULTISPECIES: CDP-alcohol phosphatidyltransferase family protein [Enterococcus]|uniref:CDP-alcohol phosphatidyltransferase family protein n=1 Tax=Enterococcus TaxID=1350 RepID=UPI000825B78C|nr:CDP-alcohol phosphatidyltransferase family protein [Enterococcus mundtii]